MSPKSTFQPVQLRLLDEPDPPPEDRPGKLKLKLLGPVELVGADGRLTSQQLSLVAFLACAGPADASSLIEAVWGGKAVSERRLANVLAEIRASIGRVHLPEPQAGRYRLHGITTDLDELSDALSAVEAGPDRDAIDKAEAVLAAVGGLPLTTPRSRYWAWVDQRVELVAKAEIAVSAAAMVVAGHLLDLGQLDRSEQVCIAGLRACPLDEDLVDLLAEVYRAGGKPGTARRLLHRWEASVVRLDDFDTAPKAAPPLGSRRPA
jgi:DNA-binding SARP family transcriptional activator